MLRWCLLAATLLMTPESVLAQATTMPGMQMGSPPAANEPASTKAYRDAMTKMDKGMAITLARDVVAAQQKEIAFMKSWQAKHAK
jgi:uncharacterized protein (DUF305 family)